jgi:CheY-like chemotaxis protein
VIDDDLDTRMVLEEVLRSEGYTVLTAPNGAEALELLRARAPRLILLDLTMPVMGGAEFRRVQVEDLELAAIPTLVMTARSDPKTQIDGLSVRGYLSKPLALDELLRVVALYCPADCAGRPPEATPVLPKGGRPR